MEPPWTRLMETNVSRHLDNAFMHKSVVFQLDRRIPLSSTLLWSGNATYGDIDIVATHTRRAAQEVALWCCWSPLREECAEAIRLARKIR